MIRVHELVKVFGDVRAAAATRVDPLAYGIDGLRGALIGLSYFGLFTDAAVLASGVIALGAWSFSRIPI